MVLVVNETELRNAIAAQQTPLEIGASFFISSQLTINYNVVIISAGAIQTLTKIPGFPLPGYMFSITNGATVTFQNITLDGNLNGGNPVGSLNNRSLVSPQGGFVTLGRGTTLQNNYSYQEGGGFYLRGLVASPSGLVMNGDARIVGCASRTSGGGVMIARRNAGDSVSISDNVFISGNTANQGGGIFSNVYVDGIGGDLPISGNVQIISNAAGGNGGGVHVTNSSGSAPNPGPVSLTISDAVNISFNLSSSGAGVYFLATNPNDALTITGATTYARNQARLNGGGVYAVIANTSQANVSVTGATFTNNTADINGGLGVLTAGGGAVTVNDTIFTSNVALNGAGGGILVNNTSVLNGLTLNVDNVTATQNQAGSNGGGILISGSEAPLTASIINSVFTENSADESGGGVTFTNVASSSVTIANDTFTGNQAGSFGGGFFFASNLGGNNDLNLIDSVFNLNTSGNEGGGMRLSGGPGILAASITNSIVDANQSEGNGGGVWYTGDNSTLLVNGATVIQNNRSATGSGGGIYFNTATGTVTLTDNVTITGNQAGFVGAIISSNGGGVDVTTGSSVISGNVLIANNTAGRNGGGVYYNGVGTNLINGGTIDENLAGINGGGLYQSGETTLTVTGGIVQTNTATVNGGGLYVTENAVGTLSGGTIQANTAQRGGAAYISTTGTLTVTDASTITGNTAIVAGPGVYNAGTINLSGVRDITNGLYLLAAPNVAQIIGPLAGSTIQLNNTPYVTPNEQGTPIVVAVATPAYPTLTPADAAAFVKPPVGFDGWEVRLEGTTQVVIAPITYTITYLGLFPGQVNPNPTTYNVTQLPIVLQDPSPIPGQTFDGWFNDAGEQVTVIPEGTTGNLVLTARFSPVVNVGTVTFFANDAGGPPATNIPDPIQFIIGDDVTIPLQIPIRPGFRFGGWNTSPDGTGITYQPGQTVGNLQDDLDLFAIWIPGPPTPPRPNPPAYIVKARYCRLLKKKGVIGCRKNNKKSEC
ncbi:InlB B-repeat-containing protein [Bacillus sp. Marseille-P3800]|uniref:InlB B-repeat-containing protein n=1 Tax=Bacillus sp. Marseille-P3800 TaxID=2014782 RepID=UPI00159BCC6F|nr:InlB B-repeat-containing protein [Bacillus sp. Marseille-P3800]